MARARRAARVYHPANPLSPTRNSDLDPAAGLDADRVGSWPSFRRDGMEWAGNSGQRRRPVSMTSKERPETSIQHESRTSGYGELDKVSDNELDKIPQNPPTH